LAYDGRVRQLFIEFEKACVSLKGEVLYNILSEFVINMKLVRLIKLTLTVRIGKNLTSEWRGTKRSFIARSFQLFFRICH